MLKKKDSTGWKSIPPGGLVLEAGNAAKYNTGSWKSFRPVFDKSKCINCMLCNVYCPEFCIPVKNGKRGETDLFHCKGCGICAKECPVKCIKMVNESEFSKKSK
ncbi:MAG: 4Fe-4S binding protein [Candidatus Aenigmarchaeota archaeon]|nr:4Fe-4S binding protein [Candidatus Aenigmarchaeota archaeon]